MSNMYEYSPCIIIPKLKYIAVKLTKISEPKSNYNFRNALFKHLFIQNGLVGEKFLKRNR